MLFTWRGRIDRLTFWTSQLFIWLAFYILFSLLELTTGYTSTLLIYPLLYWALVCTAAKRLHDSNKSGYFLLLTFIPILGPFWLFLQLGFRTGNKVQNKYGLPPGQLEDYFANPKGEKIPHIKTSEHIINDITGLNPVIVADYKVPTTIEELKELVMYSTLPVSVGGGRFSMGGQTASSGSLHIDTRSLNKIEELSVENKTITIQAGVRWCDIQRLIDPYDLSIKIMQSYANFTVGGSLSVNSHGRYVGLGPVILSVLSIDVLLANGNIQTASPQMNQELFYGAIGGYNALGIIVRATLELSGNVKMKRISKRMPLADFRHYFNHVVRNNPDAVMHNSNIFAPKYKWVNAVTWVKTDEKPTSKTRLMPLKDAYPIERYFLWSFSKTNFGKWRREYLIEPLIYLRKRVHWKNYEAGYDVMELEPKSKKSSIYALREYFIPISKFDEFSAAMQEIYQRYRVNVINISIRHSIPDPGSYLAWAKEEVFAFVIYYKQNTREHAKSTVAIWTREMNEAAISLGGTYYLPYQVYETPEQFHRAYPRAYELFELKKKLDPENKFRNQLWNILYSNTPKMTASNSQFKQVMNETIGSDKMYAFLQGIFHLYPEDRFQQLIIDACTKYATDEEIYKEVQKNLPGIKPFLSEFSYALPALKKQKREIGTQTLQILGNPETIHGYLEIGSTGRYISYLKKHVKVTGAIYLQNDVAPGNGIGDFFERGQFSKIGTFLNLDYSPISESQIPTASLDVVTCYIGLHHCPDEKLQAYIQSIHRILKPGGKFIMRDHDCASEGMVTFASLVHTVFNLGLKESWEFNQNEYRSFKSVEGWSEILEANQFKDSSQRILQDRDPSLNTLMCFVKK